LIEGVSYQVFARKYRPQTFDDLVRQAGNSLDVFEIKGRKDLISLFLSPH
jgi:hypothetical protein